MLNPNSPTSAKGSCSVGRHFSNIGHADCEVLVDIRHAVVTLHVCVCIKHHGLCLSLTVCGTAEESDYKCL